MKLRIHGNSLRLRVSESDLSRLRWEGRLESWMGLGPNRRFTYSIEGSSEVDRIKALFENDSLTLLMPREWLDSWTETENRFESMQPIDGDQDLHIIIESDLPSKEGSRGTKADSEKATA